MLNKISLLILGSVFLTFAINLEFILTFQTQYFVLTNNVALDMFE